MPAERVNLTQVPRKAEEEPPDSTFPYGPCSRCGRQSNFSVVGSVPLTYDGSTRTVHRNGQQSPSFDEQVSILQCQGCGQNVVVVEEEYVGGRRSRDSRRAGGGTVQWVGAFWWPPAGAGHLSDVPAAVGDLIAEGGRCLLVQAPRAAVVMLRGALSAIVEDLGSEDARRQRTLAGQLRQMTTEGKLTPSLADWADAIRLLGNAGAHPNQLEPVSMADARELLRLTQSVIEYLYIVPARVQRAREGRA